MDIDRATRAAVGRWAEVESGPPKAAPDGARGGDVVEGCDGGLAGKPDI